MILPSCWHLSFLKVISMKIRRMIVASTLLVALSLAVWSSLAHEGEHHSPGGNGQPNNQPLAAIGSTPCTGGMAGTFPCNKVDLASFLPIADIDGVSSTSITANDIWGWTDSQTGKEYALLGLSNGVAFVDVTNPTQPLYLGNLPGHAADSLWRGLKVYRDYLYVVSEASNHGLQVFDLKQLRNVASPPIIFSETAHYNNFGSAHTIAVNEETGYLYVAGSRPGANRTPGIDTCAGASQTRGGGLHIVDARNPSAPLFAGCVNEDGYTHETQCVIYRGPDAQHHGREICFSANEDTLTIIDVTNKGTPAQLSRTPYTGSGYTHQGWLSDDHTRFLLDDELDEQQRGLAKNQTFVWDVSDLDAPSVQTIFQGATGSIDHNLYLRGLFAFESNYRSGLRILDARNVRNGNLTETAFFDVYPVDDQALFNGTWSNYPFFASGTVIASGIEQGLFVLRPQIGLPVFIDYAPFFVEQHYRDFLNREPDGAGFGFWTNQITSCMADPACSEVRRINVSGAFFLSIEFQQTGYLVHRLYKAAYGDMPGTPVPLRREEFLPDTQRVGQGVRVGDTGWEQQLENNKNAFADEFVARQRFNERYPQTMSAAQFIEALNTNTDGALSQDERATLTNKLSAGQITRAQALRTVAEDADFARNEFNRAFVLMQYFGYLKRNPNEGRDTDFSGYKFWLGKLNEFGGNYIAAEMVKAFINSSEYRGRFGNK